MILYTAVPEPIFLKAEKIQILLQVATEMTWECGVR